MFTKDVVSFEQPDPDFNYMYIYPNKLKYWNKKKTKKNNKH